MVNKIIHIPLALPDFLSLGSCDNELSFHKLVQYQFLGKAAFNFFEQLGAFNFIVSPNHFQIPIIDKSHFKYYSYVSPQIVIDGQAQLQTFLC